MIDLAATRKRNAFERPSPHPAGGGVWGCTVHIEDAEIMGRSKKGIYGDGSLQALNLAISSAYRLLSYEVEDNGATVEDLTTIFGRSNDLKTP